jgi:hypothetical protein
MQPAKTPQKRGPKPKALKEKFQQQAKAKRGKKPMANKPHYDPMDDPDLRAGDAKGDAPGWESPIKPPDTSLKPGNQLPGAPDNTLPGAGGKPDQSLPGNPIKPGKPAPLPGGGVRPDNALPEQPEEAPKYDEVASGEVIPAENAQMLIAGTLGGSGDNHASAKRILARFEEAGWEVRKALDEGTGDTRKGKSKAKGKDEDEADAKRKP